MISINKLNKLFKMYDTFYIIIKRISKFSTYIINSIMNVILSFLFKYINHVHLFYLYINHVL